MGTVPHTKIVRVTVLASVAAIATALLQPTAGAQTAPAGRHAAAARGASPAYTAVAGRTARYVVFNDQSNHNVYLADLRRGGARKLFTRNARVTAVSGDMVQFVVGTTRHWNKIGTGRHGLVPASWRYLAPDGGLRIRHTGSRTYLDYLHLNGRTASFALPAGLPTSGATYSVVASGAGAAVAVNRAHHAPLIAFSRLTSAAGFRLLDRAGVRAGLALRCDSVSAGAVGCVAGRQVFRFDTDGRTMPQISSLDTIALRVAVTDHVTSWTAPQRSSSRICPCTLASVDASGTSESIISNVTSGAIAARFGRFYYSAGRTNTTAGVYSVQFAGAGATRVAKAPARKKS